MDTTDLREQISDNLWKLWRLWRANNHPVRKGVITPEQFFLLKKLYRFGTQRISDLAQMLGTKPSSATLSVQRLERDGLVQRLRDSEDERVVKVSLTEKGEAVFNAWRSEQRRALTELLGPLDPREQKQFLELLLKILDAMEEGEQRE